MTYVYFVSYYWHKEAEFGVGNMQIFREQPITDFAHIIEAEHEIEANSLIVVDFITIQSWQLLRVDEGKIS